MIESGNDEWWDRSVVCVCKHLTKGKRVRGSNKGLILLTSFIINIILVLFIQYEAAAELYI